MAQPPLSHQLKLLEEKLGVVLFDRNTRKLQITDLEDFFKTGARDALHRYNIFNRRNNTAAKNTKLP